MYEKFSTEKKDKAELIKLKLKNNLELIKTINSVNIENKSIIK